MAELTYEIKETLGVLSENAKGWTKELNLVSWNNYPAKYDLREWSPDHTRMGKGITLTIEEFENLKHIILGEPVDLEGDDIDEGEIL
ncbi:MAG: YdbC family protein [Oscillospiraceae bacterium]|nr:YdbC family protein [Oscillospiraceae bacterium]